MNRVFIAVIFFLLMLLSGCAATQPPAVEPSPTPTPALADPPTAKTLWQTPKELVVPESVIYDADRQMLYVANEAGPPTNKNGKGFIAQVSLDGRIINLRWVTGMNAPKGMGIFQGTLYVTDIDRIHAIDIATGNIVKSWEVADAKFLNDIAIDRAGAVYITDTMNRKIHIIQNGQVTLFMTVAQLSPNGLLMEGDSLLVGTAAGLLGIDTATRSATLRIAHIGGIDGLKALGGGKYIVSDWKGKTQIIEKDKTPVTLIDTTKEKINAAYFEFIAGKNLLLIPTFFNNRVAAYQVQ